MDGLLPSQVRKLQARAAKVAAESIAPLAEEVDRDCLWPEDLNVVCASGSVSD